jgi:hypothetical protein
MSYIILYIILYGKKPMEFFERFLSFMNIHFHVIVHVNVQQTFTEHSFHSRIFIYLIEIN